MHTPAEARALWCPMVRVGVTRDAGGPAGINDPEVEFSRNCIAERCAMWRWEHTTASVPVVVEGAGGQRTRTFERRTVRTHGYCGLAPLAAN